MVEYIDRENAYKLISGQKEKEIGMYSKGRNDGLNLAKSIIHSKEQCPTVDAVEVVRCKDCKFLMFSDFYGECSNGHMCIVSPDDFCSRGIRKDGE